MNDGKFPHQGKGAEAAGLAHNRLFAWMLAALVIVAAYNQYQIATLYALPIPKEVVAVAASASGGAASAAGQGASQATSAAQVQLKDVRPTGVPAIYGAEIGLRYDDVSEADPSLADQTIAKLKQYEDDDLTSEQMQRYIKIGTAISCEFCCGAQSIIFPNGQRACGCAHSYAMRGLAKYLLKNHGSQYTDDQILEEMGKWKVLFFPGVHAQKAAVLEKQGIELNYINLASNKYRGAEKDATASGGSGGMIGGC